MKIAYDGILGNYLNGAGQQEPIKQWQFNNLNTALLGRLQSYNAQLQNYLQATQSEEQLEQQIYQNSAANLTNQLNAWSTQFSNFLNSIQQQFQIEGKMYDDEVALRMNKLQVFNNQLQNFLNTLQQQFQLAENIYQNGTNTLMNDLKVYDDQLQNYVTATQALLQTQTQRGDNINKMLMNQAAVFNYQLNNKLQSYNTVAQIDASRFNNSRTAAQDNINYFGSRFANWATALTQQAANSNNVYSNQTNTLNAKDRIFQELVKNRYDALSYDMKMAIDAYSLINDSMMKGNQTLAQMIQSAQSWGSHVLNYHGQQWMHKTGVLKYLLEIFHAKTGALGACNNTWDLVLANLAEGIALDTAAQEGAQNPAIRLWNASVGLNQSATGVLVSMAGQGTKTTTARESGGDFFGGLFSAATTALTSGLASGLFTGNMR